MKTFETQCRAVSMRTVAWLEERLDATTGSFGAEAHDLAAYYKVPVAMLVAGKHGLAYRLLDFIAESFLQPDGDFLTEPGSKTTDPVLAIYPGYLNGWVVMGAHRVGRFDISHKGWRHFRGYQDPHSGACLLDGAFEQNQEGQREILMTAHLGMTALHMGDVSAAEAAGKALVRFWGVQPEPASKLYLRMDGRNDLVTSYSPDSALLHAVDSNTAGQAWFFVGYPIAFLAVLHRITNDGRYLDAARGLADFALGCAPHLTREHFGHKVGWAAALMYRETSDERYRDLARAIAEGLMASQSTDGGFLGDAPLVSRLDQSAEVVQWLLEIAALTV